MILIFRLGTCVTSEVTGSASVSASHLRNAGCPAQKCQGRIPMQSIHSRPLRKRLGDSRRPATCRCPGGQPWLCDAVRSAGHGATLMPPPLPGLVLRLVWGVAWARGL